MNILVVGGAGYIGSHTCLALIDAGYRVSILDNFTNGHRDSVFAATLHEADIRNAESVNKIFREERFDAVIHFAALIEAGISVTEPFEFYKNNVVGTLNLLQAMKQHDVKEIVFSSTAATYGEPGYIPIDEDHNKLPINPYGQTKLDCENLMRNAAKAYGLNALTLRYFNAAGADPEGRTGERHDPETHLIPLVLQAATGKRDCIKVFGTDYDTPDGSCIRDYIHVADLADAHIKGLQYLSKNKTPDGLFEACNLGNGSGYSVLEVIETVKNVSGKDFRVELEGRRAGDPARLVADSGRAKKILDWAPAKPSLEDIVSDAWNYFLAQLDAD